MKNGVSLTVFNGTLGANGQNEPRFPRDVGGKGAVGRVRGSHFPHMPNKISTDNARAGSSARARAGRAARKNHAFVPQLSFDQINKIERCVTGSRIFPLFQNRLIFISVALRDFSALGPYGLS